jgi:hypothetical protein
MGLRLPRESQAILRAMRCEGATLKVQRTLDGEKTFVLRALDGSALLVSRGAVTMLLERQLIASNMKFPVATYLLTERGAGIACDDLQVNPAG